MNTELIKILEDKLEEITIANAISAEDVLSLESLVPEESKGFIVKDIPIHKFTARPSRTNLEPVKVGIRNLLNSFRDTETRINGNSIGVFSNNLYSLLTIFKLALSYANDIKKNLTEDKLAILKDFKYTIAKDNTFIELDTTVPFVKAVLDTNLKDIFFSNGVVPDYLLYANDVEATNTRDVVHMDNNYFSVNANDTLFGIYKYIMDSTDDLCGCELVTSFIRQDSFTLTRGYSITIEDTLAIQANIDKIISVLSKSVEYLSGSMDALFSSDYLKVLTYDRDKDLANLNPMLCPVRSIIETLKEHPIYIESGNNVDLSLQVLASEC